MLIHTGQVASTLKSAMCSRRRSPADIDSTYLFDISYFATTVEAYAATSGRTGFLYV